MLTLFIQRYVPSAETAPRIPQRGSPMPLWPPTHSNGIDLTDSPLPCWPAVKRSNPGHATRSMVDVPATLSQTTRRIRTRVLSQTPNYRNRCYTSVFRRERRGRPSPVFCRHIDRTVIEPGWSRDVDAPTQLDRPQSLRRRVDRSPGDRKSVV